MQVSSAARCALPKETSARGPSRSHCACGRADGPPGLACVSSGDLWTPGGRNQARVLWVWKHTNHHRNLLGKYVVPPGKLLALRLHHERALEVLTGGTRADSVSTNSALEQEVSLRNGACSKGCVLVVLGEENREAPWQRSCIVWLPGQKAPGGTRASFPCCLRGFHLSFWKIPS